MADIQLQDQLLSQMAGCIPADVRPLAIRPGARGYRSFIQHMMQDIPLHPFQKAAGNKKRPAASVFLIYCHPAVIPAPPAAECIQAGELFFPAHFFSSGDQPERQDKILALFPGTIFPKR